MLGFFSICPHPLVPRSNGTAWRSLLGFFLYNDTDQNLLANGGTDQVLAQPEKYLPREHNGLLANGGKLRFPGPCRVNYIAYRSRTTHGGTAGQQTKKTPSSGARGKLGR